ncbi:MAG: zinc ribbon domain-containing protein [Nitrososphaerota archaeon]|nr:zinc ribbon domain-containing protein [Nitrososphaerota archaeon]
MRGGLLALEIILLIIGIFLALAVNANVSLCNSLYGILAQSDNPQAASTCAQDSLILDLGVVGALLGIIVIILGAVLKGSSGYSPRPAYVSPQVPQSTYVPPPASAASTARAFCPNCGQPYPMGSKFCRNCGEAL